MRKLCSAEGHDILRCPIGRRSAKSRLGCFQTPKSSSGIPLQMDSPVKTSFEGITPVKSDALQFPEVRALLGSVGSFRAMLARLSLPCGKTSPKPTSGQRRPWGVTSCLSVIRS